ncbi:MAG: TonB-dependent receptor [Sulfurimonas denitrificans]|jgi:iron complex outermembrane receptor protein|nr:TonB-dependent receptor [Sulfurimonas denitrificans]
MKIYILLLSLSILNAIELPSIAIESSKLGDTLKDSSNSINTLDKNKLEMSNIKEIKELSSLISNTNISGVGNRTDKTITMRGISNYVTYESNVAMYIDGTPVPFSYGFGMVDMNNVENIEVLKGAQGTLFGKGAESGVINIYTKAPTKTFQSRASIDYGSYDTQKFYGFVSAPMSNEDITYSLSLTKESSDGFSTNELTHSNFDDKDFKSLSAKLRYNPSTPLDVSLNYTKSQSDDGGSPFKINTKSNPFSIDNEPTNDYVKMDTDMLSLILKYKESDYTFTSATTYAKNSSTKYNYVAIRGGLDMDFDIEIEEITQEFRLKQNFENSDFLIGLFYSDKLKFDYKENQTFLTLYPVPVLSKNSLENPDENIALFSQYRYYIDEKYSVMAGLRYQTTKRSFSRTMNNFAAASTSVEGETTWTHVLPTLSFSYYAEDDSHTYLTYAKGYRPGGYNYRTSDALTPFKPETTNSLELGHKRVLNSSTTFSSALFYNLIDNLRINTFDNNLATITLSAEKAYSYGAEIEVNYKADNLNIFMTCGVIKTEISESKDSPQYERNNIIDVPNITTSIGAKYMFTQNYHIQSDVKYMGERYYNASNSAKESGYATANIGIGYKKDGWSALVYVDNIFDKRYVDFMIFHTI